MIFPKNSHRNRNNATSYLLGGSKEINISTLKEKLLRAVTIRLSLRLKFPTYERRKKLASKGFQTPSKWQCSNLIFHRSLNLQCKGHEIYISIHEPTHTNYPAWMAALELLPCWKRASKSGAAVMNASNYNSPIRTFSCPDFFSSTM